MFERFTDRARRVVVLAQEEARAHGHSFVGTEHLLLGIIHDDPMEGPESIGARALESSGVTFVELRAHIDEIIGNGGGSPKGYLPFLPGAKKALELSLREALQLGRRDIGTEHILLGLVREGNGVAAGVLATFGIDLRDLRVRVCEVLDDLERGSVATQRAMNLAAAVAEAVAQHVPTGPRPSDRALARQDIVYAFTYYLERSSDGGSLVNVERGEELAAYADEFVARIGDLEPLIERSIEGVKFTNAELAVVWWTDRIDTLVIAPLWEGTAVLVGDRWLISHDTMVGIFERAGVEVASAPVIRLEQWTGPWADDDPDANFKADIATYSNVDPLTTIRRLADNLGVPVGAVGRYVLARWATEGSGGLLELGPHMARRLWSVCETADAADTDEARLAAYAQLRAMIRWLNFPLDHPDQSGY